MGSKLKDKYESLEYTEGLIKESMKNYKFTLHYTTDNINKIELKRTYQDWNVKLIFQAPKFQSDISKKLKGEDTLISYLESLPDKIPLYILLKRKNKDLGFFFSSQIEDAALGVEYINCVENVDEYLRLFERGLVHRDHQAMDFTCLDSELQERFLNFLNEIGVNQSIVDQIENIAEMKSKLLYKNWYETLVKVLSNN